MQVKFGNTVLIVGIVEVWAFLPKTITQNPVSLPSQHLGSID